MLLTKDHALLEAIGEMTLAAGRFESDLREYLRIFSITITEGEATLGRLISELKKNNLISKNGQRVLKDLKNRRNYLTHSLFDLFSDRIKETILAKDNLVEGDTVNYSEMS